MDKHDIIKDLGSILDKIEGLRGDVESLEEESGVDEATTEELLDELESRTLSEPERSRLLIVAGVEPIENLRDQMKYEYFMENIENITEEDMRAIVEAKGNTAKMIKAYEPMKDALQDTLDWIDQYANSFDCGQYDEDGINRDIVASALHLTY